MTGSIQEMFDQQERRNELQVRAAEVWVTIWARVMADYGTLPQSTADVLNKTTDEIFALSLNALDRYWQRDAAKTIAEKNP